MQPHLALLIKQKFRSSRADGANVEPRDSVAAQAVSQTESNPLNDTVGYGYI